MSEYRYTDNWNEAIWHNDGSIEFKTSADLPAGADPNTQLVFYDELMGGAYSGKTGSIAACEPAYVDHYVAAWQADEAARRRYDLPAKSDATDLVVELERPMSAEARALANMQATFAEGMLAAQNDYNRQLNLTLKHVWNSERLEEQLMADTPLFRYFTNPRDWTDGDSLDFEWPRRRRVRYYRPTPQEDT